ncbi:hypothetical protein Q73A0000_15760 [Kaistella flava (ex Peng et al. 2021)]|uniref:Uncharacterized protein n=1 Tax=Kaistella flava (ex Peng et al. 2021) TaxID=2038776 RepID=A0A7M2YE28_9FLAO|nr:hypothetical protein [Kaistella flava (ex Peng et al. 2021)]QOW11712.1 hypothetical protein Q73A0000_15760 [Kaistella flava (ex Peng et al. 2021)]
MGPSEFSKIKDVISVINCTEVKNDLITNFRFQVGNHWNYLSSSSLKSDVIFVLNDTDQKLITKRKGIDDQ